MKTTIKIICVTIVLLIAMRNNSFAQCSNTNTALKQNTGWCRSGNTGVVGDPHNFGTFFNEPINIFTNGTQKMIILANGKVGIGTVAPRCTLEIRAVNSSLGVGGTLAPSQATGFQFLNYGTQHAGFRWTNDGSHNLVLEDASASFSPAPPPPNAWYTGTPVNFIVRNGKVGIGTTAPSSILDVKSGSGDEVFRTTSNATGSNNFNAWRMFTGTGTGTEKFALLNPAGTNDILMRAPVDGANMQFQIGGNFIFGTVPITRMVITDGAFFGSSPTGLIGMGNGFLSPQSQLHLNDGGFATYLQITNFSTNTPLTPLLPTATDGFKLGIDALGNAQLIQQESAPMSFSNNCSPC